MFERLGVKPLINGHHWRTVLGGSTMPPEVLQAMVDSADYYVNVDELNRRAGDYIASITGAEGGMVTAGCAAAQVLQAAACMSGVDEDRIRRLPDTTGMRNEVLVQKMHRNKYDVSYRLSGATLVDVGSESDVTLAELEAAMGESTAAVAYVWNMRFEGLSLEEVIQVAHRHDVPVIVDAAAELPPVENLTRFISMGVDMVAYSGGKGVRGPQSTGILAGRGDLIESAHRQQQSGKPWAGIGRPMKVCKEEIVGLVRALELFVDADHEAEWAGWRHKANTVIDALKDVPGVSTHLNEGPIYPGPTAPTATIVLGESWQGPFAEALIESMLEGDPPVYIGSGPSPDELWVATPTLQDGEEEVVARRLLEVLALDGSG
jgi:L-seryl-tRNA(Ser) seleniumtransferase